MSGEGVSEVLSLRKGGRNFFSHAKGGGGRKVFGVVLTRELEVFAILLRAQKVSTL